MGLSESSDSGLTGLGGVRKERKKGARAWMRWDMHREGKKHGACMAWHDMDGWEKIPDGPSTALVTCVCVVSVYVA